MGFLDTPTQPKKLSIEKVIKDGVVSWRHACPDASKCERKHTKACNGFILLTQPEPPKSKDDLIQCFYAMPKTGLEW